MMNGNQYRESLKRVKPEIYYHGGENRKCNQPSGILART